MGRVLIIVAVLVLGALALLPLVGGAYMGFGHEPMMAGYRGYGAGPGFFILGGLFRLLLFAGLILLVVSLVRGGGWRWNGPGRFGPPESALDILKRRLAKGEITRDEYDSLKNEIA